jgi:hypothetical protein
MDFVVVVVVVVVVVGPCLAESSTGLNHKP